MLVLFSVALVCLTSGIHSARPCESLVHPLVQLDSGLFQGVWALVAGSLSHRPSMKALRLRDSITVYFSNQTSNFTYTQINRFGEQCHGLPYNISVNDTQFSFDVGNRFQLDASFRDTSCPDCLVMRWDVKSSRRSSLELYLLSRRREVQQEELEEFRAQLECYNLPQPVVMDPSKEMCPH